MCLQTELIVGSIQKREGAKNLQESLETSGPVQP